MSETAKADTIRIPNTLRYRFESEPKLIIGDGKGSGNVLRVADNGLIANRRTWGVCDYQAGTFIGFPHSRPPPSICPPYLRKVPVQAPRSR